MEDRGNKLYTSHRIILPEFRRRLLKTTEEITTMPHLDEEVQTEIEQRIKAALATGAIVRVLTGQVIEDTVGVIKTVSMSTQEIKVETVVGRVWLKLEDIVGGCEGRTENTGVRCLYMKL